ncbi:hypothetical protein H310_02382 [Aphanomyces invadans]|uniref:RRM domain-containing protein n=1 Tax=Aphanomyces invadans TaxID=157072 RepID=A0A024UNJ1_9STRA|nr:hypothetical protein H310_02382 [Aphanomyces invadans]ETW08001.1 hypothetical protein H310_02382 [Aphanomyces invadans]|eukprot:XP_008864094.1 hypothetical protein H310_02382 [Aphanomyces invadans]
MAASADIVAAAAPAEVSIEEQENDSDCRVYVGRLTSQANETDLQAFFRPYGVIRHIWIARKPPGFAFVTYSKADAAQRAVNAVVAMKNPCILGQTIKCQLSKGDDAVPPPASAPTAPRTRVRKRKGETFKQRKERKLKAIEASSRSQSTGLR